MAEPELSNTQPEKSGFSSRYNLESKLGTGGMGVVYKGYDNVLCKPVAVKVLLPNSQADAIIRFHQEAKMTAKLSHLNILTVLDFGQNEAGDLYLVMDFLDGESLQDLLKSRGGSLPLHEAVPLFLQMCSGLQHAHSQGILHRDIKPSNIMLVKDERGALQVKIVDFGLAKVKGAEQSLTTTGMRVGSPLYMSPEQAQTDEIDQRSDIYSLGCLMYKTLTGKAPLVGETFLLTLNMHVHEIPKCINEVNQDVQFPSELADIVAKTLEKNPDDRFQSCAKLAEALMSLEFSFLSIVPPAVTTPVTEIELPPIEKKGKTVFGVSVNLLSCAIAVFICVGITGKALIGLLATPDPPKMSVKTTTVDPRADTMDVMSDKLYCHPDGLLSANADFGDDDMHEVLRFEGQTRLTFEGTMITGKSFAKLRELKKLEQLNLADTKIDDGALKHVGRIATLRSLILDRDRIGDIGLGHLSNLKELESLSCEKTLISNLGIEALIELKHLKTLNISGCTAVSGAALDVLRKLPSLRSLYVVQCPNIAKSDIERFKLLTRGLCEVNTKGALGKPQRLDLNDPKQILADQKEHERNVHQRHARLVFMRYKDDMLKPRFFRFFQNKDCWRPRKSYDDITDPRIVECLKDKELQEVLKNPHSFERWHNKKTWDDLQQMDDKMNAYFPPEDLAKP